MTSTSLPVNTLIIFAVPIISWDCHTDHLEKSSGNVSFIPVIQKPLRLKIEDRICSWYSQDFRFQRVSGAGSHL